MGKQKIVTSPHLVFLPKAAVFVGVHPVHMSSKRPSWDWVAVGGAWRKEGVEREARKERIEDKRRGERGKEGENRR